MLIFHPLSALQALPPGGGQESEKEQPDTTLLTLSTLVAKHPIQGRYLINLIVQGLLLQVHAMLLIFRARYKRQ
jgi:hypothetical protein